MEIDVSKVLTDKLYAHKKIVYIDCEWNKECKILALSYCYDDLIPCILLDIEEIKEFCKTHSKYVWVGHNIKSDLLIILENTGYLHQYVWDTMIASQIVTNGMKETKNKTFYSLGNIIKMLLGIKVDKQYQVKFLEMSEIDSNDSALIDYIKNDIIYLKAIRDKLIPMLKKHIIAFNLDMQVVPILTSIEYRGMLIDPIKIEKLDAKWKSESRKLQLRLKEMLLDLGVPITTTKTEVLKTKTKVTTKEINFNSAIQVKEIFKYLDIDIPLDKHDKETINKDVVKAYLESNPDCILKDFLLLYIEYKEIEKLISSWGIKLLNKCVNNIVSTEYTIATTSTGRLSSKGNNIRKWTTNIQNIPAKTDNGKEIMKAIIARKGYKIAASDMAGAELRIAASKSRDDLLMANFNAGADFHSELATCSWQAICEYTGEKFKPVTKKYPIINGTSFRDTHKGVNFGILYGASAKRVASVLNIPLLVAEKAFTAIKLKVSTLMAYLEGNRDKARRNGYLINPVTGRIKYNLTGTEAFNWEIQNTNAEAMKVALILIAKYIKDNKIDAHIINTVHDSIVIEIAEKHIIFDEHLFVKKIMTKALEMFLTDLDSDSDITVANYWKK